MNEFFFMNEDEEKEKYGQTTKVPDSLISGQIQKQVKVNKVSLIFVIFDFIYFIVFFLQANKLKQIMEFKVRVLDFISIYVKEMNKEESGKTYDSLRLIKGLLKALQVAHADKNTILFDRIKSVLTMIAKGGVKKSRSDDEESGVANKDSKILMTEVMALV